MSSPTVALYYSDDYRREMEATLLAVDGSAVQLDQTVFYPRGGNQDSDKGTLQLAADAVALPVNEVTKDDAGAIHHHLGVAPGPEWAAGAAVHGALDWQRRLTLMRLHTAQHLISRWYLDHGENGTTRVDINELGCTIEFARPVTLESALDCLGDINALVAAGRPVRRLDTDGYLEIIVEGFDRQPCGGTHVADVAEIGRVALLRHKGNRLEIAAGLAAQVADRQMAHAALGLLSDLEVELPALAERAHRLVEEQRAAKTELHTLREEVARARIAAAAAQAPNTPAAIDLPMVEAKALPRLLKPMQGPGRIFVCLCAGRNLVVVSGAPDHPANALAERIKQRWSLSGGGSPAVAMCGPLPEAATVAEVLATLT